MSIWARPALTLKEATSGTSEAAERAGCWAGTKLVGVVKVILIVSLLVGEGVRKSEEEEEEKREKNGKEQNEHTPLKTKK